MACSTQDRFARRDRSASVGISPSVPRLGAFSEYLADSHSVSYSGYHCSGDSTADLWLAPELEGLIGGSSRVPGGFRSLASPAVSGTDDSKGPSRLKASTSHSLIFLGVEAWGRGRGLPS